MKGHTNQLRPLLLCIVQDSIDICIKCHKSQLLKARKPAPSKNKEAGTKGGGKVQGWQPVRWVWQTLPPPPTTDLRDGHLLLDLGLHTLSLELLSKLESWPFKAE